jgi:WD40 repeat protein
MVAEEGARFPQYDCEYRPLDLKRLKIENNPAKKREASQSRMFTYTSGLSIDFSRKDPTIYFAATDDGTIHRCSTAYTEQYLDTFFGHHGPVYKVRCNPFAYNYFLTCSYDWTARLWNLNDNAGKMIFSPPNLMDQINDIEWSPNLSTRFSLVTNDGRVEIWDCEEPLQPVIAEVPVPSPPNPL